MDDTGKRKTGNGYGFGICAGAEYIRSDIFVNVSSYDRYFACCRCGGAIDLETLGFCK